jgi:cytochrome c oxidase assembly protein subunit 15
MSKAKRRFSRVTLITTIAVYFLILVGGIVRNTGSGMGCPDWPKCFGGFVPPTSAVDLPEDYQSYYLEKRLAKTERLVVLLNRIGLKRTAELVENDPYLYEEESFDVTTAWIEYLNRLLGVLIGFLILATTYLSFSFWRSDRRLTYVAVFGLVLVLFQGWFGSLVVATNLIPAFVSVHMSLAFLQILLLIYLYGSSEGGNYASQKYNRYALLLLIILIPQLYLGTQVRHIVDLAVFEGFNKAQWLTAIDWQFYVHRSMSLVFLFGSGYLFWDVRHNNQVPKKIKRVVGSVLGLVLVESVGGAMMFYFDFPPAIQPIHLLAASLLLGLLYYLFLSTRSTGEIKHD